MGFSNLGRKLFEITQKRGKALLSSLKEDLKPSPRQVFKKWRAEIQTQSFLWLNDLEQEMRQWILEEGHRRNVEWSPLWGRDPKLEKAYQSLQLPYGATREVVKTQFRQLLKQHHPDRFIDEPVAYQRATQTSQQLTEAYHTIQKAFDEGRVACSE
ncbi:MAG: J domain-containing protein, partial [Myxococcota bacterium]